MSETATEPKRRFRWYRYSLRSLMGATLLLAVWLGWICHTARQQSEAVQAVRALEEMGVKQEISLIVSGGIKDGSDVAKSLALGADAVALGTGVMVAMGCVVCLRCHEGKCAFGIGTQDPERRKKLDIEAAAQRVANYIEGMTCEATLLAKAAGKTALANMEREDLRAMTLEACAMTGIPLLGNNYTFGEAFGFF